MLKHLNENSKAPNRVVVLGAHGFVGSHIVKQLQNEGLNVKGVTRKEVNLLEDDASSQLLNILNPDDSLVIVSAIAPCKNNALLLDNLRMMHAVTSIFEKVALAHVVYISSDAVYADDVSLATENSNMQPSSLHGMMHSARELMLKTAVGKTPLAILRPSLLYGLNDPHNGYGPNRFRRLIEENKTITLFGEGEEMRDHIYIEDVAKVVSLTLQHRSQGALNIATGRSLSFREIAEKLVEFSKKKVEIQGTPRQNPITYRHFDITACHEAFPKFHYTSFEVGMTYLFEKEKEFA